MTDRGYLVIPIVGISLSAYVVENIVSFMAMSVFSYNSPYPHEQHSIAAKSVNKIFVFIL